MLDLWFVTSYVSHTTSAHTLHYPMPKAAFILPLSLESAHVHNGVAKGGRGHGAPPPIEILFRLFELNFS